MDEGLRSRLESSRDRHLPSEGAYMRMHGRVSQRRRQQLRAITLGVLFVVFVGWGGVATPTPSLASSTAQEQLTSALRVVDTAAPSRDALIATISSQPQTLSVTPIALGLVVALLGAFALILIVRTRERAEEMRAPNYD